MPPGTEGVVEVGRVMATLDDWRTMMFIMVICLFGQTGIIMWLLRSMSLERRAMWSAAQSFGTNAEKVADALGSLKTEIVVLRATASRVESVAAAATTPGE